MKKKILYGLTVLSCFGAFSILAAADETPAADGNGKKITEGKEVKEEVKEEVEDFSKGFSKFYKFGLPKVNEAEYYKLSLINAQGLNNLNMSFSQALKGNAWKLPGGDKTHAKFIINESSIVDIYDYQKYINEEMNSRNANSKKLVDLDKKKTLGTWKKTNLKKDAKSLIQYLQKGSKKKYFWMGDKFGTYFLFAVHLDEKGFKKEANQIAGLLFKIKKNKREVILAALNTIADTKYTVALHKFYISGNWDNLKNNISKLLTKYKRGWKKSSGVKELLSLIEKQQSKESADSLLDKLPENDKKRLLELEKNKLSSIKNIIWTIPGLAKMALGDANKNEALAAILNDGMKSVKFLTSLLGSKRLLKHSKNSFVTNSPFSHNFYNNFSFISQNENDDDEVFKKMNRPMTEDEFAKYLLKLVVFDKDASDDDEQKSWNRNNISKLDTDEFRDLVKSWYKDYKDKKTDELLVEYIKFGKKSQKTFAVEYILANNMKDSYNAIDKFLLADDEKENDMEMEIDQSGNFSPLKNDIALKYVSKQGKNAADFVKKYIEKIDPFGDIRKMKKEDMKIDKTKSSEEQNAIRQNIKTFKLIKRLQALASPESVEEIIDDLLGLNKESEEYKEKLTTLNDKLKASDIDIDKKINILLTGALKATQKKKNLGLLFSFLHAINHTENTINNFALLKDGKKIDSQPDPKKNVDLWQKLFLVKKKLNKNYYDISFTVDQIAKLFFENIYNESNFNQMDYAASLFGKRYFEIIDLRIKQKISGKENKDLPKLPKNSISLKKDENKIALEQMSGELKNTKDIIKKIKKMPLDKILIFKAYLDKNKKLNKKIIETANKIVEIETEFPGSEKFKSLEGKILTDKDIISIKNFASDKIKSNKKIICKIVRKPLLGGVTILIAESESPSQQYDSNDKHVLSGYICIYGECNDSTIWQLDSEPENKKDNSTAKDDKTDDDLFSEMEDDIAEDFNSEIQQKQIQFMNYLKDFSTEKYNSLSSGIIYFH